MIDRREKTTSGKSGKLEGTTFKIDETNVAHILHILRDQMYSDKIGAVIREYSCNAYDSHVQAGKPEVPIEVKLPTSSVPYFSVKDIGVGLSHEEILNIYTSYGSSTKRDSDDVTGTLGLGSKSAYAYGSTFNVIATKDGSKRTYTCYIDSTSVGRMDLLSTVSTTDPDGVQVNVPVKPTDFNAFRQKSVEILKWFKSPVKIDGAVLNVKGYTKDNILTSGSNWALVKGLPKNKIIMGNVAYDLSLSDIPNFDFSNSPEGKANIVKTYMETQYGSKLILEAGMGDIDFVASRESLELTKRTRSYIIDRLCGIYDELNAKLTAHFKPSDTLLQQCVKYAEVMNKGLGVFVKTLNLRQDWQKILGMSGYRTSSWVPEFKNAGINLYNYEAFSWKFRNKKGTLGYYHYSPFTNYQVSHYISRSAFFILKNEDTKVQWKARIRHYLATSNSNILNVYVLKPIVSSDTKVDGYKSIVDALKTEFSIPGTSEVIDVSTLPDKPRAPRGTSKTNLSDLTVYVPSTLSFTPVKADFDFEKSDYVKIPKAYGSLVNFSVYNIKDYVNLAKGLNVNVPELVAVPRTLDKLVPSSKKDFRAWLDAELIPVIRSKVNILNFWTDKVLTSSGTYVGKTNRSLREWSINIIRNKEYIEAALLLIGRDAEIVKRSFYYKVLTWLSTPSIDGKGTSTYNLLNACPGLVHEAFPYIDFGHVEKSIIRIIEASVEEFPEQLLLTNETVTMADRMKVRNKIALSIVKQILETQKALEKSNAIQKNVSDFFDVKAWIAEYDALEKIRLAKIQAKELAAKLAASTPAKP